MPLSWGIVIPMNITASAAGHTFTRTSKVAWTHANVTVFANGYAHINWAKSLDAAQKLAAFRIAELATDQAGVANPIASVHVVATSIA